MEIRGDATPALELVRQMKLATGEGEDLVPVVRAGQQAGRDGLEAFMAPWFLPDFEWDLSGSRWASLGFGVYRGYGEFMRYWEEVLEVFSEFRFTTEWVQAAGDVHVLGEARSSGSFRETGLAWSDRNFEAWTIRNGRIGRLRFCDSLEEAQAS
jgi:ketosteroid isomerase-like protein